MSNNRLETTECLTRKKEYGALGGMKGIALLGHILAASLLLAACAISSTDRVPGKSYAATDPEKVEVLYQQPNKPFEVIGFVSIDITLGGSPAVTRKFQSAGAKIGADAVIVEALPRLKPIGRPSLGSGKAIRWAKR